MIYQIHFKRAAVDKSERYELRTWPTFAPRPSVAYVIIPSRFCFQSTRQQPEGSHVALRTSDDY